MLHVSEADSSGLRTAGVCFFSRDRLTAPTENIIATNIAAHTIQGINRFKFVHSSSVFCLIESDDRFVL